MVTEQSAEKEKYSKFWDDLESTLAPLTLRYRLSAKAASSGRGYKLSFRSPKDEKLSLFQHGERAFDHIILLPTKSKGSWGNPSHWDHVADIPAKGLVLH